MSNHLVGIKTMRVKIFANKITKYMSNLNESLSQLSSDHFWTFSTIWPFMIIQDIIFFLILELILEHFWNFLTDL